MKLWDIVKTVGPGLLSAFVPGAGLLLGAVNEFLPDDKKLPVTATGTDLGNAIKSLPAEQRGSLLEKEFDVDIVELQESHSTLRTMLDSDAKNPHTTRPYIAKHSFHVIAFTIVMTVWLWGYGIYKADTVMVKTITNGWPFLLSAVAPLAILLRAYFGVLKQEHRDRLSAADTKPTAPSGIAGLITSLIKK